MFKFKFKLLRLIIGSQLQVVVPAAPSLQSSSFLTIPNLHVITHLSEKFISTCTSIAKFICNTY